MSSASARAQEPSMEEILASIRRIISDDQDAKPEAKAPEPEPTRPSKLARGSDTAKASSSAAVAPASQPAPTREARAVSPQAVEPARPSSSEAELDRLAAELAAEMPRPAPAPAPSEAAAAPLPAAPAQPPSPPRPEPSEPLAAPSASVPAPGVRGGAAPPAGLDLSRLDLPVPDITFSDVADRPAPAPIPERPRASVESLISQEATASVGDAFNFLSHTILSTNARTLEDLVRDLLKPMLKTWLDDNLPPLVERLVRAEIERVARGR